MIIFQTPSEMAEWSFQERKSGLSIGFVPTMGALHHGHIALIQQSISQQDRTVVSIFVNPLQFNSAADLKSYPRQFETDSKLLTETKIDVLYAPSADVMYPQGFATSISAGTIAHSMEGLHRPGHFDGVATVVSKLLNSVMPTVAYFGNKDFQQVAVIRQVVKDLDIPCQIVGAQTVRDSDGLALSSRNVRLTAEHRVQAPKIYQLLEEIRGIFTAGTTDAQILKKQFLTLESCADAMVEYFEVVDSRSLISKSEADDSCTICVAVWFGDVRLIDNISLAQNFA
jgi:pantoate--beta-alanine ligase